MYMFGVSITLYLPLDTLKNAKITEKFFPIQVLIDLKSLLDQRWQSMVIFSPP